MGVAIHSHVQAQIAFSLTATTDYSSGATDPTFFLEPSLDAGFFSGYSNVNLRSPDGSNGWAEDGVNFSDDSRNESRIYITDNYSDLLNVIGFAGTEAEWSINKPLIPKWTLTLNEGLANQQIFEFGLFANDLASGSSPFFDLIPSDGATVLQKPTFEWDLIPGNVFTRIELFPSDGSIVDTILANLETSWTPSQSIAPGDVEVWVTQTRDVQSPPSVTAFDWVSGPTDGQSDLSQILVGASQESLIILNLVAVPETHEWALLTGFGLAGFALLRQRRRSR